MSFKSNLRKSLAYKDISAKELAAKVNVPYTTILSYINSQECIPKIDIAFKIANELDVSIEYLITGDEKYNTSRRLKYLCSELSVLPISFISSFESLVHQDYFNNLFRNHLILILLFFFFVP